MATTGIFQILLFFGLILLGLVLMMIWRSVQPAFFRGETLRHDTPVVTD